MKLAAICGRVALVSLLCAVAACGGDGGGSSPPANEAQVSTLAYVVTRCHEEKGGRNSSASQTLWIRQGDRDPVKIAEYALGQPAIGGLCRLWGQSRNSVASYVFGAIQRFGFTADGARFLFEVTDDFSVNTDAVPADQQGIFAVRADGTGLQKIAPPSRDACFRIYWPCVFGSDAPECTSCSPASFACFFAISDDGRHISYTDIVPSRTGDDAPQIFTLDLTTGEPEPVTHLPLVPASPTCVGGGPDCVFPSVLSVGRPRFLGRTTIQYERGKGCSTLAGEVFTVNADGSEEPKAVPVVALPGGTLLPVFQITGEPYVVVAPVPMGTPENETPVPNGNAINEVFVIEPPDQAQRPEGRVLQLTNFRRADTTSPGKSADGQHVLVFASADPLGTNPSHQCQIFSIDRLGGAVRQITSFTAAAEQGNNCVDTRLQGCTVTYGRVDRITDALVFGSTCDPLGQNPTGVEQLFAIRQDGTGLTQVTQTQGVVQHADGSIDVEMAWGTVPATLR